MTGRKRQWRHNITRTGDRDDGWGSHKRHLMVNVMNKPHLSYLWMNANGIVSNMDCTRGFIEGD